MNTRPVAWTQECDCHIHIFEEGHALAPTATFVPPHAPLSAYRAVQRACGLQRVVVVQPTGYGFDNRCTLGAVAQLGADARAVVVVPEEVPEAELLRLHAAGARGVRFMMLAGGVLPWSALGPLAARIAPLDWNINLQLDGCELPRYESQLQDLPCPLVIDHVGKFLGPVTLEGDAFSSLRRLLDAGNCWIKLSAPYESSRTGPPGYDDVALRVQTLAQAYPERCQWASNWPHPNIPHIHPAPSSEDLLAWALQHIGSQANAQRILVDNPARLYGFPHAGMLQSGLPRAMQAGPSGEMP